jgi:probable DNA metabolism protein
MRGEKRVNRLDCRETADFFKYLSRHKHVSREELRYLLKHHSRDDVLNRKTPLSQRLYRLMREVRREYRRHIAHLRFQKINNLLISPIYCEHRIEDLLTHYFSSRHPEHTIILLKGDVAYIGNGEHIGFEKYAAVMKGEIAHLLEGEEENPLEGLWGVFYDSQYIPSRKNRRHAARMMPKKYQGYSREVTAERLKIEGRGDSSTLTDYFG